MWRALFLAVGIYMVLFGGQCFMVERVSLGFHDDPPPSTSMFETPATVGPQKQFIPPPWVPWSMMSSGVVVCLYSFTIPRRVAGK
jgi:hypothetical protein